MEKELIVKWKIKETETSRILKLLPELAEKTTNEIGNIFYAIYQSENDPNEFILHERYTDERAAETHRNSEHYQKIVAREIIPHLEAREVMLVKKLMLRAPNRPQKADYLIINSRIKNHVKKSSLYRLEYQRHWPEQQTDR